MRRHHLRLPSPDVPAGHACALGATPSACMGVTTNVFERSRHCEPPVVSGVSVALGSIGPVHCWQSLQYGASFRHRRGGQRASNHPAIRLNPPQTAHTKASAEAFAQRLPRRLIQLHRPTRTRRAVVHAAMKSTAAARTCAVGCDRRLSGQTNPCAARAANSSAPCPSCCAAVRSRRTPVWAP